MEIALEIWSRLLDENNVVDWESQWKRQLPSDNSYITYVFPEQADHSHCEVFSA